MSANSKIEWTDHTFNPWIGCTKVSPACDGCYAEVSTPARALHVGWGAGQQRHRTSPANWAQPLRWNAQADAFAAQHSRRQRVFCASLADVFDNEVPTQWRSDLFDLIKCTPGLDWLLLTKRIGNAAEMIAEYMRDADIGYSADFAAWPWPNVWLGATICNQAEADRDIPKLLAVPARVRFLSIEPLLGPLDLTHIQVKRSVGVEVFSALEYDGDPGEDVELGTATIDWVIVGGESGHQARPMHPSWARSLRDQCAAAGVPYLFKQWGEWAPMGPIFAPPGAEARHVMADGSDYRPGNRAPLQTMFRIGKKAAGRWLDGVQHDGVPS
jgi:protein gp37